MTEETKDFQEVKFTIEEVASWDDDKCKELEETVKFPLTNVRTALKEMIEATRKFEALKLILFKGLLRGYTISCPECKDTYNVSVADFVRDTEVLCPLCGKPHKENSNIINVIVDDTSEMVKPKKKRASRKKSS